MKKHTPSQNMIKLLDKIVKDPVGWGIVLDDRDGRKRQGTNRTLWALERLGLVCFIKKEDSFIVNGVLYVAKGPGWIATETGCQYIRNRDNQTTQETNHA
jgi:hypothetical protein